VKVTPWADGRDTIPGGRVFEYTEVPLQERFKHQGGIDFVELATLPTLFVEESYGSHNPIARVGRISRARPVGANITLEYSFDAAIPGIANSVLQGFAAELDINAGEFSRTHWSVKEPDLFHALLRNSQPRRHRPRAFSLAETENIEQSLMSAMMPFHPGFDAVYIALQGVAKAVGLRCRRADDIWESPAVIQDVVSLIDKSKIVICDCTGRNPNVFYEIGIAHTLGREVILITQSEADIPFDLRHLRYLRYLNNGEGLLELGGRLQPRLAELAQPAIR
jgi:hypothetical protein